MNINGPEKNIKKPSTIEIKLDYKCSQHQIWIIIEAFPKKKK